MSKKLNDYLRGWDAGKKNPSPKEALKHIKSSTRLPYDEFSKGWMAAIRFYGGSNG